jgi:hypothetical protein
MARAYSRQTSCGASSTYTECAAAHLIYYLQKVDMCSGCAKLPIANARALLDSA